MVLIIDRAVIEDESGKEKPVASIATLVRALENDGLDHRAALKKAARELGLSRAEAYRRLITERSSQKS
jgi:predicted transcriptional regulator YheO